jgi:phosphatidylserine/phosphatidylglycerophosphate/cardiolipin synthase-like enzyme
LDLLSATRWVSGGEFAEHADALLRSRVPGQDLLLFQSGDGESGLSFVFFDLSRRQSVLIAAPPVAPGDGISHLMRTLVRVPDTLILRGQALGMLTRPVSSAARLAWLATETAATIAPPVHVTTGTPPPLAPRPAMNSEKWERELDGMNLPRRYLGTIAPLIDGEAFFTSFVQALQDARESVSIRLYIFDNDDYAVGIADLLKRRSEDVRVRVLIDGLGTLGVGQGAPEGAASRPPFSISRYLRTDSHVQVREAPNTWLVSDHTKTLIIDDRLAYVGGMNIGHEYRHQWHDMMVGLIGPIVRRLQRDFDVEWAYAGLGGDLAYLHALGDEERGAATRALVKSGVRVFVYPGMTHVKAALYDGWACVGSANFDKLSLRVNRETNVATSDPVFVGRLQQELFETDFARSRELVKAPSTGWGTYIAAYVAGQL